MIVLSVEYWAIHNSYFGPKSFLTTFHNRPTLDIGTTHFEDQLSIEIEGINETRLDMSRCWWGAGGDRFSCGV